MKWKIIVINSLNQYYQLSDNEKKEMIKHIKIKLEENNQAIQSIGIGYSKDMVRAGNVFLRIIKNE